MRGYTVLQLLADNLAAHVRGHDDDGVLEVARAALVVGQTAVLEHLQQDVEHVGMRLLNLVEQHDAVGFAAHSLGQLPALVVAHIPWRRSDKSTHTVALLILTHVDTHHHVLVVEEHLGEGFRQLRLADTRGAQEDEAANRALAVTEARTAAANGIGDDADGLILTHHALVQLVLEVQQPLALALQHARHRNAGPLRDHLGNLLAVHLLVDHRVVGLHLLEACLELLDLLLGLLDAAVAQLGHLAVVARTLGLLGLELVAFDILHLGLNLLDDALLVLPAGLHLVALLTQRAEFLVDLGNLVLIIFTLDGLALNLQLTDTAFNLIKLFRHRVNLQPQLGSSLVDEVDGLVGQETVADVAVAQLGGGNDGLVLDPHAVVHLVALLQATQDADGVRHRRLVDKHALESALEGLILLKVFLVLGQGGGADGTQLASCQCGLQDIGGIHSTLTATGTHKGVDLVDEKDDLAVSLVDFADDALEPLLELALVLRTGDQGAHVETVDSLALQVLRHIAAHDTLRQPLGDSRLTHAGLADQDGVVLRPAAEDLQHTAYLLVAPDHRVQLAGLRQLVQILGVLAQGVHRLLLVLARHLAALAQILDGGQQSLLAHPCVLQQLAHAVPSAEDPQQQVLHAHELVVHLRGALAGGHKSLVGVAGEVHLSTADVRHRI